MHAFQIGNSLDKDLFVVSWEKTSKGKLELNVSNFQSVSAKDHSVLLLLEFKLRLSHVGTR